jgi:hypothetical protein
MFLPVQRAPVQRSIIGLRSDLPGIASGAAASNAADGRGIEPSGLLDDIFSKIKPPGIWEEGGIVARPLGSVVF